MPARYRATVAHRRSEPFSYSLGHRITSWLVDLDQTPALPVGLRWVASFAASDHPLVGSEAVKDRQGTSTATLRQHVDGFLASRGEARPARVLMLATPRILGHVFNPLSVFYCYDEQARLDLVLAEVRNTYRGRHVYLLRPDEQGAAQTEKQFYVSPYNPVDGGYRIVTPSPGRRLRVTVQLERPGHAPFVATLTGSRTGPASRWALVWEAVRRPWASWGVSLAIRRHGIRLYIKGLRPHPRPTGASR